MVSWLVRTVKWLAAVLLWNFDREMIFFLYYVGEAHLVFTALQTLLQSLTLLWLHSHLCMLYKKKHGSISNTHPNVLLRQHYGKAALAAWDHKEPLCVAECFTHTH